MVVTIHGINKVIRGLDGLHKNFPKIVNEISKELAKSLQKGMKMRAPKSTGFLRQSIHVEPTGKKGSMTIMVDAPYAQAVEYGFTPHMIPSQYFRMRPFSTEVSNPNLIWVGRGVNKQPFVKPAIASFQGRIVKVAERIIAREIARVGFK